MVTLNSEPESRVSRLKTKGKQDLKAAERKARRTAAEVKRRGEQDIRAGTRAVRREAEAVRRGERRSGGLDTPNSTREIIARAGAAAQLRAPMDNDIEPSPDGPSMEMFAAAGVGGGMQGRESQSSERESGGSAGFFATADGDDRPDDSVGMQMDALVIGDGARDRDGDGNDLDFDDPFGASGGGL